MLKDDACVSSLAVAPHAAAPRAAPSLPRHVALEQLSGRGGVEVVRPCELAVLRFLGSGGSGDVFLARWHGSEVAVKCLHAPPGMDEVRAAGAGTRDGGGCCVCVLPL